MIKKKSKCGRPKLEVPTYQKTIRLPDECIKLAEKYNIDISKVAVDGIRNESETRKIGEFLKNPKIAGFRKNLQNYMKEVREKDPDFDVRADDAESFINAYMYALNNGDEEQRMAVKFELRNRHPAIYDSINEFEQFVLQHPERYEKIMQTETENLVLIQKTLKLSNELKEKRLL